jgi:dihydroflavonol-4-reductase
VNVEGTRNVLNAAVSSPAFEKLCYTSTVNVLGVPNPVGSIGNFETSNPYTNQPWQHSFRSREEVLKFIERSKKQADKWWNEIGIGYYDSKLAAQELVNEYAVKENLNVVSLLPGTMFGPYDYLIGTGLYILSVYKNKMPAVIKGAGLPLAHVMDVARGHVLAMQKAAAGTQYILSGKEEDNRSMIEMVQIITEVLSCRFPQRKFNRHILEIPLALAYLAAFFSEQYAKLFNKAMLLSRDAVRAGKNPLFYTSQKAKTELGYVAQFTFRQAVKDMVDYYTANGLLEREGRWIDRR